MTQKKKENLKPVKKKKTASLDLSAVKDLLKQNLESKQIESASCKIAIRKLEIGGVR